MEEKKHRFREEKNRVRDNRQIEDGGEIRGAYDFHAHKTRRRKVKMPSILPLCKYGTKCICSQRLERMQQFSSTLLCRKCLTKIFFTHILYATSAAIVSVFVSFSSIKYVLRDFCASFQSSSLIFQARISYDVIYRMLQVGKIIFDR